MTDNPLEVPKPDTADRLHTAARAGISLTPGVGGAGVELFKTLVVPSLERRQTEWMDLVADKLRELEAQQRTCTDDLTSDEEFIDTVMRASHATIRTSNQEKKDALRNAVLNAALPHRPDESRQLMFIGWVESLTPWHLRILNLLAHPLAWYQKQGRQPPDFFTMSSLSQLLTHAFPALQSERSLYDKIAKDLYNDGLLRVDGLHTMMSARGAFEERATDLGNEFLRFITDPTE